MKEANGLVGKELTESSLPDTISSFTTVHFLLQFINLLNEDKSCNDFAKMDCFKVHSHS